MGIPVRPPHFDLHQSGTIFNLGAMGRMFDNLDPARPETPYLAGAEYSMGDIITFPWRRGAERRNIDLADYLSVKRWHEEIEARPAVQRGVAVLADRAGRSPTPSGENYFAVRSSLT
jgi:glutathione S-transferase